MCAQPLPQPLMHHFPSRSTWSSLGTLRQCGTASGTGEFWVLGRQHGGGLNGSSAADGARDSRPHRPQQLLQRFGTLRQCAAESVLVLGRSMWRRPQ